MFIRIGGIPGVGKTSAINLITTASAQLGLPISKVKGGDYLLKLAGVQTYDELRAIPEEVRAGFRPQMFQLMYAEDRQDPNTIRLRDAHFSLFQPEEGGFTTFPTQAEDQEQMLAMILLTAPPETVLRRRLNDLSIRRDRTLELQTIQLELDMELQTARAQSEQSGKPLIIVENRCLVDTCTHIVRETIPHQYGRVNLETALTCPNGKECHHCLS